MIKSTFQIVAIFLLCSCATTKYTITQLPLAKDNPVRLEDNKGVSYNTEFLKQNKSIQLLGTHDIDLKNYQAIIQKYTYDNKSNKFSMPTHLSPKSSKKNRVINGIVKLHQTRWIYYSEADSLKDYTNNYRAELEGDKLFNVQPIQLKTPLRLIFWQKYYALPNGKVVMVYRSGKGMFFSKSKDGINFKEPLQITKIRSSMPFLLVLDSDHYLFSFLSGGHRRGAMKSNFAYSNDAGKTWSSTIMLSPPKTNAHDAFLFKRLDGLVDAYYVYPIGNWRGFSLFRRCIKSDYSLGENQLVVEKEFGNLAKPSVFRLDNNEILITFINQFDNYNLYSTKIYGDAPCK